MLKFIDVDDKIWYINPDQIVLVAESPTKPGFTYITLVTGEKILVTGYSTAYFATRASIRPARTTSSSSIVEVQEKG